jgi:hypothetical protein
MGTLELIVARPAVDERALLEAGTLDRDVGLVGDGWSTRPSSTSSDAGPNPAAQVTDEPHLGCGKFSRRFGVDALKLINSDEGRAQRLRGFNARVVEPGAIAVGDPVRPLR